MAGTKVQKGNTVRVREHPELRGVLLELSPDGGAALVGPIGDGMQLGPPVVVPLAVLEVFPTDLCIGCLKVLDDSPETLAKALKKTKELFRYEPPPERRMPVCGACGLAFQRMEREEPRLGCQCAAKYGLSVICTCEARRADTRPWFPPEE
jgi:hypothetical protein